VSLRGEPFRTRRWRPGPCSVHVPSSGWPPGARVANDSVGSDSARRAPPADPGPRCRFRGRNARSGTGSPGGGDFSQPGTILARLSRGILPVGPTPGGTLLWLGRPEKKKPNAPVSLPLDGMHRLGAGFVDAAPGRDISPYARSAACAGWGDVRLRRTVKAAHDHRGRMRERLISACATELRAGGQQGVEVCGTATSWAGGLYCVADRPGFVGAKSMFHGPPSATRSDRGFAALGGASTRPRRIAAPRCSKRELKTPHSISLGHRRRFCFFPRREYLRPPSAEGDS